MEIKDYKCKCGHNDFFFMDKGNQKGIYCSYCGKWLKWADKDEQNLALRQESTEEPKDHSDDAREVFEELRAKGRMTEEERKLALYCLKASSDYHSEVCEECVKYPNCDHTQQDDVTETIIKALEQEPCDNAISRDAVLEIFANVMDYWREHAIDVEPHEIKDALIEQYEFTANQLSELPPVTPQPKIGHWIDLDEKSAVCSCCYRNNTLYGDFCKWCGTKMQEIKK